MTSKLQTIAFLTSLHRSLNFFAVLFFLFGIHPPTEAIKPQTVRETSIAISLGILMAPIVYDLSNSITGARVSVNLCKDAQVWLGHAIASAICGASTYYVLNKYTPKSKYDWALSVMQKQEEILSCDEASSGSDRASIGRIQALYNYYHDLTHAINDLDSAPKDVPDDHSFKRDCEKLVNELKHLQRTTESYAMFTAHKWFEGLTTCSVPENSLSAIEWSATLIGKRPGLDYRCMTRLGVSIR